MKRRFLSFLLAIGMLLSIFNVTVMAANEPTITSHKNGYSYAADDFYIKWNAVSGAKRYRLAVKSLNDGSYAADIYWDDRLTKNRYEVDKDNIKPGHRYRIWVGACGSSHEDVISQYSIEVTAKAAACDHVDYQDYYDYSKYEQISGDNKYHNVIHYYKRACEDCNEIIKTNVKGNIEKEKHNFSGDKCKACGYKKTCSHSDYEDYYEYTKYEQISNDNNYHNAINYYERVCEDCDKTIKTDVKGDIKKEAHSFSGDKCASCGYVKKETICQHPNYEDYYSTTKYEQISGDNNYHNVVNYYDRECDDCGKNIKTDIKGEIKIEAHSFSGDECKSCGYVKKETVCQCTFYDDYYSTTKYEQISGDDNYHNAVNYYDRKCDDCGKTLKTGIKGEIKKESHSFSGNKCTICKYTKQEEVCKHSNSTDNYEETKYSQISGDNTYHNAIPCYNKVCNNCKEIIQTNITGNAEKEKHSFSGNKCTKCNYQKQDEVCKHISSTDQYYETKCTLITGDDIYHTATHYYNKTCNICGEVLEKNRKGNSEKIKHNFFNNKCTECNYTKKVEDNTNPQIGEIKSSATNTFVKGNSTTITTTVTDDNLSAVKLYVDGKEAKSFSTTNISYKLSGLSVGAHQIKIFATDKYKNSAEKSITLTVTNKIEQEKKDKKNQTFTDVSKDEYYADDIEELNNKGIITGYGNGEFKPYNTLTRAEAAVILCRLNGNFDLSKSKTMFTDVDSRYDWASGYIAKAVQLNLISGVGNNKYEPGETLTYEQFITMIVRWLGLENNAKNRSGEHWADGFITVADEIGMLDDISVSDYACDILRAHASVIANTARGLKGNVEKEAINESKKDDNVSEGKIHTSSNNAAVYKRDGKVLGDVDGLSCSLYAPDSSYDGISTTVRLKEVSTKLYGEGLYNDTTKDSDNAYIYLGINTDNYGYDLGLIKNNYSHCKNYWRITNGGLSIPSRYKKFKHEEYVIQYDETYIYKVIEKDDGNVEVTNYYINDNSKNNELTLSMKYDSVYYAGKKENGLVFEIYNSKGLIFQSIILAERVQNALFSRIVSATNSIVTESRYKDWSKASDDSSARYIYQLSSSSNMRKESLNKGYEIDNYRNNYDGRDEGLKIENVVFYDTFLYKNSRKIELVIDSLSSKIDDSIVGRLWLYPNKDINCENITTDSHSNPIVSITEQYINGKVYDTVNISN